MALEDKARGQRIAALRKGKHFTQQAMAEKLGIAYRTYQTWEAGTVMPEWPNLEKLATFYGVKPEDIIGETPDLDALLGRNGESQLDRMEAELAAIRVDIGTLATQLEEMSRLIARIARSGSSGSRSRKAK